MAVEDWVRELTESVIGGSPLRVGARYLHPEDGLIEITAGQYWGERGLSNFWHWVIIATGEERSGYGDDWPSV